MGAGWALDGRWMGAGRVLPGRRMDAGWALDVLDNNCKNMKAMCVIIESGMIADVKIMNMSIEMLQNENAQSAWHRICWYCT